MANPVTKFAGETTAAEVAEEYKDQVKGKIILITGCSPGGLGFEVALTLAAHSPKLLILAGRSIPNLAKTEAAINEKYPTTPVRLLELDLSSQVSVRTAAKEVLEYQEAHIDILINNAAVSSTPYKLTTEGIEFQFATNHIGPFLFTNLILPKIAATATTSGGGGSDNAKGRIVNVASIAHSFWKDQDGTKLFQDYNCSNGEKYAPMQMYFRSKAANILFTVSLHEKLKDYRGGVTCVCMCPGRVRTQLGREIDDKTKIAMGLMDKDGKPTTGAIKWRSMEQGAATHVYLALGPEVEGHGGEYFQECNSAMHIPMPWAVDSGNAAELWELSEKLVGETFAY